MHLWYIKIKLNNEKPSERMPFCWESDIKKKNQRMAMEKSE